MTLENQPYDHRPAIVQEVLGSPGFPLEPAVRILMEARFARDFGHVRLHTDDQAAASARAIGAQAYTVGSHIVFADGRYHPETRMGLWLLAHELAHVVQQDGADIPLSLWLGDVNDPLEYAADRTADLVATGRPLPPDFTFGAALAGVIQCHPAPPCPESVSIPADASTIFEAHQILERAYVWENIGYVQENAVFFGSNWGANPPPIPPGAPRQQFASALLARLLLWPVGDRPNIIDFWLQAAYWFRRVSAESGVVMAITRFHNLVHILQRQHNEPEWFSISSMWWPDHTQYFPGDPLRRFLCTEATNHNPPRGLILYDVRQPPRQRRQRPSRQLDLVAVDPAFIQLTGDLRAELPKKIRFFDPDAPNHVIIAPREVAWMFYQQYNETLKDKHMRVKPSYDFPGGRAVKDMRARLHFVSKVLGVVSAVIIIVGASVVLIHVAAVGATVGTGAMVGTGTTVGTGATVGPTSTIVAPAAIAGKVVSATGAAVTATEMAAYAALLSAPTVKTVAATAGVLMIVGFTKTAKAAGPKSTQATQPTIERVLAIRAIPIGDFKPIGGIQSASSAGPPLDFAHTPDTSRGKFNLGTEVLFDNLPHVIIGQLAVR